MSRSLPPDGQGDGRSAKRPYVVCHVLQCKRLLWPVYYRAPGRSNMKSAGAFGYCAQHGVMPLAAPAGHLPGCTWSTYEKGDVCICGFETPGVPA